MSTAGVLVVYLPLALFGAVAAIELFRRGVW